MTRKGSLYVVMTLQSGGFEETAVHHLFGMIYICIWYKGVEEAGAGHRVFAQHIKA